jgi:Fe-S oxidoreductase/nitrate reductase gamma subunit
MEHVGREIFWNVGQTARWFAYALMVITFVLLIYGVKKRYAMWRIGKPTPFSFKDRIGERIGHFITAGIFHRTILRPREAYPGMMHLLIFWGFQLLAIGTALVAFEDDFFRPLFGNTYLHGNFYLLMSFVLELAGLAAIVGILMAMYRRYIAKPERVSDNQRDDLIALVWILVVLVTGFLVEGARIAFDRPSYETVSFVGWATASLFDGASKEGITTTHAVLYYVHMILSFGLIAYIVFSGRLLHILNSTLNMMFRAVEDQPRGAITPIADFETAEEFGVNQIDGFTWRQIFDLDACTRCGRCQDRCPAHLTQKPLTPKQLIQDLKGEWLRAVDGAKNEDGLLDNVIQEETVWSCTACLACQVNCPVSIPTFDKTLELRRYLIMTLSQISPELKLLYKNLQTRFDPYGMGKNQRLEWAEGLDIKKATEEQVDVLYWVGCVASLDDRNRKIAKAMSTILTKAGVSFGVLGPDEKCCGDPLRRTGNEYQYQEIAEGNVEFLKELGVKTIVTGCPHCYNTLKNDYAQFGVDYEVYHHTEYIDMLAKQGKIKIDPVLEGVTTYHDPCYLGRVNQIFDAPRAVVDRVKKDRFVELPRNRDEGFCCGGGGGKIWMEEHHGRICHERMNDVIAVDASTIVTACPYCLIMMEDAIKDKEKSETVKALDISEIVAKSIQ